MPQRFCAACTKPLTPSEITQGQIQCATCYQRWLKDALPAAEAVVREIMDRLHDEDRKNA
jgi:uncharacterized Zn finger protein (UPF0148 family)